MKKEIIENFKRIEEELYQKETLEGYRRGLVKHVEGLSQYMSHKHNCNINGNWDEARQALQDTPQKFRDDSFYEAEQELEIKAKQCTCGLTPL